FRGVCMQGNLQALLHAKVQCRRGGLRQIPQQFGAFGRLKQPQVCTVTFQALCRARCKAGNTPQQGGLACPVRAHHPQNPATLYGPALNAAQNLALAQTAMYAGEMQARAFVGTDQCRLRLAKTTMKNGMPTRVVTTPTGISTCVLICLDSTEAPSKMSDPVQALAGRYQRWSSPHNRRAMWGAISPTKPTTPMSETAAAVSKLIRSKAKRRTRGVSTPRLPARSSPKRNAVSAQAWRMELIPTISKMTVSTAISRHELPPRLPIIQYSRFCNAAASARS